MEPRGKNQIVIIIAIVLVILIAGYFTISKKKTEPASQTSQNTSAIVPETPNLGSEIGELSNPLGEKLSDLNPVEKTNPFTNVYKNPFE